MTAENFLVNDRSDGQAVKAICKCFPQFDIVSTFTLIIKSYKEQGRERKFYFHVECDREDEKLDFPIFAIFHVRKRQKLNYLGSIHKLGGRL